MEWFIIYWSRYFPTPSHHQEYKKKNPNNNNQRNSELGDGQGHNEVVSYSFDTPDFFQIHFSCVCVWVFEYHHLFSFLSDYIGARLYTRNYFKRKKKKKKKLKPLKLFPCGQSFKIKSQILDFGVGTFLIVPKWNVVMAAERYVRSSKTSCFLFLWFSTGNCRGRGDRTQPSVPGKWFSVPRHHHHRNSPSFNKWHTIGGLERKNTKTGWLSVSLEHPIRPSSHFLKTLDPNFRVT